MPLLNSTKVKISKLPSILAHKKFKKSQLEPNHVQNFQTVDLIRALVAPTLAVLNLAAPTQAAVHPDLLKDSEAASSLNRAPVVTEASPDPRKV